MSRHGLRSARPVHATETPRPHRVNLGRSDGSDWSDPYQIATASPEVAANTMICVIHQATYLLRRQLARLEQDFRAEGGFTERLYRERRRSR